MTMIFNQTHKRGLVSRDMIADCRARHYMQLKMAIWLYLYFLTTVNQKSGKLVSNTEKIAYEMGLTVETVQTWLGLLKKHQYIQVTKERKSTIFSVVQWKMLNNDTDEIQVNKRERTEKKPICPQQKQQSLFKNKAEEIIKEFGESQDRSQIEKILENNPNHIIQFALDKVRSVPDHKIKKSRMALFIYLIKTYGQSKK